MPGYVEKTFRQYLECGILAYGFAWVFGDRCRNKHLVDEVLARVPIRWEVPSVPKRVRFFWQRERQAASSGD